MDDDHEHGEEEVPEVDQEIPDEEVPEPPRKRKPPVVEVDSQPMDLEHQEDGWGQPTPSEVEAKGESEVPTPAEPAAPVEEHPAAPVGHEPAASPAASVDRPAPGSIDYSQVPGTAQVAQAVPGSMTQDVAVEQSLGHQDSQGTLLSFDMNSNSFKMYIY